MYSRFATGVSGGDQDYVDNMGLDKIKSISLAQTKQKSNMRNKWVELPDCAKFGDVDGNLTVAAD